MPTTTSLSQDSWERGGRVPTMDGFRAVAIILVVLHHVAFSLGSTALSGFFIFAPHLGVDFAFVVSGFLITLLLLRERQRYGKIALRQFYARRALRLLPALAVFLLAIFLLTLFTTLRIAPLDWAAACTYTMCFRPMDQTAWQLLHLWTAAVEEHFYILWPLLFYLLQPRRAALVAIAYICVTPLLRIFLWTYFHHDAIHIDLASPTQMSNIAAGCVAACFAFTHGNHIRAHLTPQLANAAIVCSVLAMIASMAMARLSFRYRITLTDPTLAICIAALLLSILYRGKGIICSILESRPMVIVGTLSYSIYLWQQPFTNMPNNWFCQFPQNIFCILAAAAISYWLVEKPFLRLRERLRKKPQEPAVSATAPSTTTPAPQNVAEPALSTS